VSKNDKITINLVTT